MVAKNMAEIRHAGPVTKHTFTDFESADIYCQIENHS
jgi:hypothetical protein